MAYGSAAANDSSLAAVVFAAMAQVDLDTVTPIVIDVGIKAYSDDHRPDISPRLVIAIYNATPDRSGA